MFFGNIVLDMIDTSILDLMLVRDVILLSGDVILLSGARS